MEDNMSEISSRSVRRVIHRHVASLEHAESPGAAMESGLSRSQRQWIAAFLIVGIAARVARYVLCFPLWEDECFLSANYLHGGYMDMLKPLNYHTVCPVLFSWVQLTSIKLFGFTEYSLRLFPFFCGMASLWLFWDVVKRLLGGATLMLAVALFAASYPTMRYVAEAKPYSCDLMVSLVLMALLVRWWQEPSRRRWLWALCAAAPLAVGLSYPAVFVGGGLSLLIGARLYATRKEQNRGDWIAWAAYSLSLAGSFAVLFAVSIQPKLDAQLTTMTSYWLDAFPPLSQPWKLPLWLVEIHAGSMLAYPVGGPNYGSLLALLCCLVGGFVFWHKRQYMPLGLTLAPLALNFAAAAMRKYPYGDHMRMTLYMAPMFCILMAAGVAAALSRLAGLRAQRQGKVVPVTDVLSATGSRVDFEDTLEHGNGVPDFQHKSTRLRDIFTMADKRWTATLALLMLVPCASIVRDFAAPYKSSNDLRARGFAQWFWFNTSHNGETVCLHSDLSVDLEPETFQHGSSASYLCNQRIYSPRHSKGLEPQWDRISADWPLRCVQYRSPRFPSEGDKTAAAWLETMSEKYQLVGKETYPFPFYDKRETELKFTDYIDVYKFVPKDKT
jgi:hypothetical protein